MGFLLYTIVELIKGFFTSENMIFVIGFLAQIFFSARIIFQWIMSEKARKVVSPSIFWILSILAAYLLFIYGWLRSDFAIILGQFISYYIYIWNLREKGIWRKVYGVVRVLLLITPVLAVLLVMDDVGDFVRKFFHNDSIPTRLLIYGSLGQVIFTLRFIYQWFYSRQRNESILPVGFWVISLIGSAIIVSYGFIRKDPVLILGQSVGFIAYTRNIMIYYKSRKQKLNEA